MNTAEIKLDIFRQLDTLNENHVSEVYGVLLNFINSKTENEEWDSLEDFQKKAILDGLSQLNVKKNINHQDVVSKAKLKYGL